MEVLALSNSLTIASVHPPFGEKHTNQITGVGGGAGGWTGAVAQAERKTIIRNEILFIGEITLLQITRLIKR
jgi:hypothetical protein